MNVPKGKRATSQEANWVAAEINQLRAYYDESHRNIHYIRRMRFMRLKSNAPRPFQRLMGRGLQSPFSYRLVQTAVGMIGKERPRFTRLPRNDSSREREAASRLQRSADPLLQMYEQIARRPLFWQLLDGTIGDGRAHIKVAKEAWSGFPLRRDDETDRDYNKRVAEFVMSGPPHPLRSRLVDPMNVLVPPTEYAPPWQIEQGKRPLLSTMNKLGLRFGTNNSLEFVPDTAAHPTMELPRGMTATTDVEELWTPDTVFIRIAGKELFKFENDLGFIPYVNVMGEVSSLSDPSLQALSILYPYQGIEPWLATLMSTMAAWSILGGTPILWTARKPYQGAPPPNDMALSEIPLGRRVDLGTGGEIGFVQPPPIGREVLEFLNTLVSFLDRAGITPLASGILGNRTPGTAFSAAIEAATGKLKVVQDNLQYGIADWVRLSWRTVENINQPIWVTGIGLQQGLLRKRMAPGRFVIDPKDINGYYDLTCELTVSSLQDTISKGMHSAFMKSHKLWSRDRAMRFAGVDDPWEEFKEVLRDGMEESPLIQGQILQEALKADPELAQRAAELEAQGVDIRALLTGMGDLPGAQDGAGVYGNAPQPRGGPAPRAGGKSKGAPRRPGGKRQGTPQGTRFPK